MVIIGSTSLRGTTNPVRFAREMQRSPGKLIESLKEDRDESMDIFSRIFRRIYVLSKISIGKANTDTAIMNPSVTAENC